jgi:hypothetical protein
MFRFCAIFILVWVALSSVCLGCECLGAERPCEYLRSDTVFVGRVVETVAVKHPMEKNSWTPGYSMRFAVDESLRGGLGTEVTIETGGGGGDCGTPLTPGERFLIFAYKEKDGRLWTGMCSGNRALAGNPSDDKVVEQYRALVKSGVGTIFGRVAQGKPVWREDDIRDGAAPEPVQGMILHANAEKFSAVTKTAKDGSYEFDGLPNGKYTVTPEMGNNLDFDREYFDERYRADVADGQCANIGFNLKPKTRIRGHVTQPVGLELKTIEVVAIPIGLRELNQFSGKSDFTDENGRFDLWPLPPGDYYVGVNINNSPKADAPFPPTYFPGVTSRKAASIVHVEEGEVKDLELPLPEVAKSRTVHFVAIGLDGKPLRAIYVQLEDLRHPGDAGSYVNVDLNNNGEGTLTVYSGYSYHLHGSHWVSYGNDWCSKPVVIAGGTGPVDVRFVMDRKDANCQISEIDGLKK